jgi:hypothetical protein
MDETGASLQRNALLSALPTPIVTLRILVRLGWLLLKVLAVLAGPVLDGLVTLQPTADLNLYDGGGSDSLPAGADGWWWRHLVHSE